jgi:hypothetical protein
MLVGCDFLDSTDYSSVGGRPRGLHKHVGVLAAVGASAVIASLAVVMTLAGRAGPASHPSADSLGRADADKIAIDSLPPPLSLTTIRAMHDQGTQVSVGAAAATLGTPAVPERTAIATAATQGNQPAEVSLASVTVTDYGEGNPDPNAPTDLKLYIEDRQAWVVVLNDIRLLMFGQPYVPGPNQPTNASNYAGRLFVLIDAQTGEHLRAESL